jgi:hypothetical protein
MPSLWVRRTTFLFLLLCAPGIFAGPSANGTAASGQATGTPRQGTGASSGTQRAAAATAPSTGKSAETAEPQVPARLELLETHYRFEADGSSRKEVHTVVKINSELGVRQFAHLNFDYNRAFETVEIPLVRVTHSSGGTADVLPSAITDAPNPAVVDAPAYQDVRVKSVRILGLEPSDRLEYRVITTVSHHPLAPDFWLAHSFDRSGVVGKEIFEIDLPESRHAELRINPATPATSSNVKDGSDAGREIYLWVRDATANEKLKAPSDADEADIALSTFASLEKLSERLADLLRAEQVESGASAEVSKKAGELTHDVNDGEGKIAALYDFAAEKIATVDLPLGTTEFRTRSEAEILSSGYGTAEDKFKLFAALARAAGYDASAYLAGAPAEAEKQLAYPSPFTKLITVVSLESNEKCCGGKVLWLDLGAEVAPMGMVSSAYRGKPALGLENSSAGESARQRWTNVPLELPFAAKQNVRVDAGVDANGKLTAKVKYVMRGDNELLLRIAFHQSAREKWKSLAQLLSLSDGFRGQISSVSASDPLATHEPFTVEYEIAQAKFVDWGKKPVRIPALLPLVALPDPSAANADVELGTPLEVETEATLALPAGFAAQAPIGTSVERDYATFASKYGSSGAGEAKGVILTASRHIHFIERGLPAARGGDYRAFLRAVQNDEAQSFVITGATAAAKPAVAAKP